MIDAHAHYDDHAFDEDRDTLLPYLHENGVEVIINSGADLESSKSSIALAEKYDFVYAAVGFHPDFADKVRESDYEELLKFTKHEKVVAVGEIGLDYHYGREYKEQQKEMFARQMNIAHEASLPVVIHEREACADALGILKNKKVWETGGLMHCFSESPETMEIVLSMGMYISLGGVVTFKNAKTAPLCAAKVPKDRLLLETDCPYLAPVPYRGKRNNSLFIKFTAEKIAELRGVSASEIISATAENARRFYGI